VGYREVLGVSSRASDDEVRDAYVVKSERMNPEQFAGRREKSLTPQNAPPS
jgi:curved DNA-binding protein CbpA